MLAKLLGENKGSQLEQMIETRSIQLTFARPSYPLAILSLTCVHDNYKHLPDPC